MNSLTNTTVTFIGAGNIAWSLIPHFQQAGIEVPTIISRSQDQAEKLAQTYHVPKAIELSSVSSNDLQSDFILLCIPDHAIEQVANSLPSSSATLMHCSGSVPLSALSSWSGPTAVWYPLQMFTQTQISQMKGIPILLEGDAVVMPTLEAIAEAVSGDWHYTNSEERLRIHAGAVFACNFPNHLFTIAAQLVPKQVDTGFGIYEPLLKEMMKKVFSTGPEMSQTGPAIRGDHPTLTKHMEILANHSSWQVLYRNMSNLIRPDLDL